MKKFIIISIVSAFLVLPLLFYLICCSTETSEHQPGNNGLVINSHKINYVDQGRGIPLILIHGFGSSLFCWRKNIPALSERYRVYALDLLGFGFSDKPLDENYSMDAYAELIIQFMNALKIERAVLVGHSLGGGIAMLTTLKYPKRVLGLILIDPEAYALKPPFMLRVAQLPIIKSFIHHAIGKWTIRISLERSFYNQALVTDELVDNYYRPFKTRNGKRATIKVLQAMDFKKLKMHIQHYRKIKKYTLIVWGKEDRISNIRLGYRLHKDLTKSILKVIPESGHLVQEEKPNEVNNAINNFLRIIKKKHKTYPPMKTSYLRLRRILKQENAR